MDKFQEEFKQWYLMKSLDGARGLDEHSFAKELSILLCQFKSSLSSFLSEFLNDKCHFSGSSWKSQFYEALIHPWLSSCNSVLLTNNNHRWSNNTWGMAICQFCVTWVMSTLSIFISGKKLASTHVSLSYHLPTIFIPGPTIPRGWQYVKSVKSSGWRS